MRALLILNRKPYEGTRVTWDALRLAEQLLNAGLEINVFLTNDAVDQARDAAKASAGYFDLGEMLKGLIRRNVPVKVCGICKVRCGVYKGEPYLEGAQEGKMTELAEWIREADRVVSF
jgi:uncharacterized protein involved in oxidation of intracellular sulfur